VLVASRVAVPRGAFFGTLPCAMGDANQYEIIVRDLLSLFVFE